MSTQDPADCAHRLIEPAGHTADYHYLWTCKACGLKTTSEAWDTYWQHRKALTIEALIELHDPRLPSWDVQFQERCRDIDLAMAIVKDKVDEADFEWIHANPHEFWHEYSTLIALHNEVVRLRMLVAK